MASFSLLPVRDHPVALLGQRRQLRFDGFEARLRRLSLSFCSAARSISS